MKKKGFTMVELLAVLVILAIVLLVVIPSVLRSYENSEQSLYDILVKNICSSSETYLKEYRNGIITLDESPCTTSSGTTTCVIDISELQKKKYINKELENPLTGRIITPSNTLIKAISDGTVDSNGSAIYKYYVTIDSNQRECENDA